MKKCTRLLCIPFGLAITLSACSNDDASTSPSDSSSSNNNEETIELRVVTTMAGTDPGGLAFNELIEDFQNENDHISIINESQSADAGVIRTKVNTDFSSNNEPDLMFYFNTVDAQGIIDQGLVVDLEKAEDLNLEGFHELMYEQQRNENGGLYAVPQSGFYEALFVNEALFEEHGVELPTTWELYEEAIRAFAETDIVPVAVSTEDSYYLVEHYILAAGGIENFRAELSEQDEAWAEGLDKIAEHAEMGAFPVDAATIDLGASAQLFHSEQAAMLFEGSWAYGGMSDAGIADNVRPYYMPVYGDGGETGDLVGGASQGWFISTKAYEDDSKHDAVVDFFNFITSEESIVKIADATMQVPAKGSLSELPETVASGHALSEEATGVEAPINDRIYPEAFTHIRQSVPEIVNGSKTGAQVIEEAAELE